MRLFEADRFEFDRCGRSNDQNSLTAGNLAGSVTVRKADLPSEKEEICGFAYLSATWPVERPIVRPLPIIPTNVHEARTYPQLALLPVY